MLKSLFMGSVVLSVILTGCVDDGGCCGIQALQENSVEPSGNMTPIANFENLKIVSTDIGCQFSADGSASKDSDGNISSYVWTIDTAEVSTVINPTNVSIACDITTSDPIVCLSVVDDKNASSISKCTTVKITGNLEPKSEPKPTLFPPTAVIGYTKAVGEEAYYFNCNESYDNDAIDSDNNPENDNGVISCHWTIFKTDFDGSTTEIPHEEDGFLKWVLTSPDKYSALQVTLKVVDDDNQSGTITNSYKLSKD